MSLCRRPRQRMPHLLFDSFFRKELGVDPNGDAVQIVTQLFR
ncbi:hypothetical protein RISK_006364 [Rhodopirellula islandica]|uniref:Uncharacterized protein n=1 Tax=Rhodopirellula islandica TaxID=595434 RepID=A0A0J1B4V0_RHOIS|nr:hypothetical protein RISK_006364 [Rhodopirellula islandica]